MESIIKPPPPEPTAALCFPDIAWRGLFADYRAAMAGTTEASDVAHFATFWAAVAVTLDRKISIYSGDTIFPNAFVCFIGPTGDKKTTAERRILSCGLLEHNSDVTVIRSVGTTEGYADKLDTHGLCLFLWEEFSEFLSVAHWSGSTLPEFITETFDCPPAFERTYRKKPVNIIDPTPTILTATTPEWFWAHALPQDFHGGFANRFMFLSGPKKPPIPSPAEVNGEVIFRIKNRLRELAEALTRNTHTRARLNDEAQKVWNKFYVGFENRTRRGLLAAALKRSQIYIQKLALTYSYLEGTFPEITAEQLRPSIAVILYSAKCVQELLEMQKIGSEERRELETRCLQLL